jgi:hypothetical protein
MAGHAATESASLTVSTVDMHGHAYMRGIKRRMGGGVGGMGGWSEWGLAKGSWVFLQLMSERVDVQ